MLEQLDATRTVVLAPGDPFPAPFAGSSDTGAVLYEGDAPTLVVPPFPVHAAEPVDGTSTDALRDMYERPRTVGVILLRLGGFAVGVFEGERLVDSKVGTRFVKGRHSKGGSSQARFARRREGQVRELFEALCTLVGERLATRTLDHAVTGGDRRTLAAFLKACPQAAALPRLSRVLDVGDPRQRVLEDLPRQLYASDVLTPD